MTGPGRRTSQLLTLALLLYPGQQRRRYGPEIRELLQTSASPVRDLADIARSGLRERVTAAPARPWARVTTGALATLAAQAAPLALSGRLPWAAAVVGIAAGLLLTRRCADLRPALLVTSGALVVYLLPHLEQSVAGEHGRTPELIGTAAFGLALILLAPLLHARPARRMTAAVTAVGVLTLPALATTLLAAQGHLAHPWRSYWLMMSPAAPPETHDALSYYPALYTCCAFLLIASAALGHRPPALLGEKHPATPA
jgi:hypothetical protein